MPGVIQFGIKGAKEMERLLKELGPRTAAKIGDQAVRAGLNVVAKEARSRVRVRTGDLRKSIKVIVERRRKGESERVALLGFEQPVSRRAHFEEFGRSNQAAHPFIRPAMDAKAGEALDAMGKVLAKGITKEAEKLAKTRR